MARLIQLSLTDELGAFVESHSGDGTLFNTPDEFVRAVLRERKEHEEAAGVRGGVLEGYGDVMRGRVLRYGGSVTALIAESRRRDEEGWS